MIMLVGFFCFFFLMTLDSASSCSRSRLYLCLDRVMINTTEQTRNYNNIFHIHMYILYLLNPLFNTFCNLSMSLN